MGSIVLLIWTLECHVSNEGRVVVLCLNWLLIVDCHNTLQKPSYSFQAFSLLISSIPFLDFTSPFAFLVSPQEVSFFCIYSVLLYFIHIIVKLMFFFFFHGTFINCNLLKYIFLVFAIWARFYSFVRHVLFYFSFFRFFFLALFLDSYNIWFLVLVESCTISFLNWLNYGMGSGDITRVL